MGTLRERERERELAAVAGLLERRGARFRDVKHVSFKLMYDRLLLLEQLGLIPAPATTS